MDNARPFSLRRRLLLLLLSAVTLLWLVTAVTSFFDTRHEINELLDAQLAQSAQVLLAQAAHDLEEVVDEEKDRHEKKDRREHHKYEQRVAFQIWDADGQLVLRSANAPLTPLAQEPSGYSDSRIGGQKWRVFSRWDAKQEYQIQVGERYDERDELAIKIARRMLYPLLFALPVLALLIWLITGRGLAPLQRVSREVAQRAPQRLDPLAVAGTPEEILPLVQSLNTLFRRLEQAFENERRFTADAAHELRTPLAALKTQAQVALRAGDAGQRTQALQQVIQGVDRATHLVQQLLTLARLDPQTGAMAGAKIDLQALAASVLAEIAPAAVAKDIELSLAEGGGSVLGDATALGILIRNLADNAVRYTPPAGRVTVSVAQSGGEVMLEVTDTGPGIPPEERARVLERFYRVLGSGEIGSGLGLSIVKRIAELHGARVSLSEGENGMGLRVRVVFGKAEQ